MRSIEFAFSETSGHANNAAVACGWEHRHYSDRGALDEAHAERPQAKSNFGKIASKTAGESIETLSMTSSIELRVTIMNSTKANGMTLTSKTAMSRPSCGT